VLLLLCYSFALCAHAQAIDTNPSEITLPEPAFAKAYIKKNKIKTIRASIVDKPDGEVIRDKGLAENFVFNEEGFLVRHYYNEITSIQKTEYNIPPVYNRKGQLIKKSFTKVNYEYQYDTLGTEYVYTSNGFLRMQRMCMGNFYHTTYYEYYGEGMVSRKTLCRETNISKKGEPFKLGVQTIISDERFEYEQLTPSQIKKVFLNDEGKPYKMGILNFSSGKITDESYEFVVGFIRSSVTYKYDEQGRLIEKIATDNSSNMNIDKTVYEYDENGNVVKQKKFSNGTQIEEIVFLYDAEKNLLTSQINRQILKENIRIVKYEYEFYP
jgi:hypothetical protein